MYVRICMYIYLNFCIKLNIEICFKVKFHIFLRLYFMQCSKFLHCEAFLRKSVWFDLHVRG